MPAVRRTLLRLLLAALVALGVSTPVRAQSVAGDRATAQRLRAEVAAQAARVEATGAGLGQAEQRLALLVARVGARRAQLAGAEDRLVRARVRLTRLQQREHRSQRVLAGNLASGYRHGDPTYVSVIVSARGFTELLERVEFLKRVSRRARYGQLAAAAVADRDAADVLRGALLRRQATQLARRDGTAARLAAVRGRIARVERRRLEAARQARAVATAAVAAPRPSRPATPSVQAPAAGGGADAGAKIVAAATQIAGTPYVWGGGHGGASGGYDCSGSISYALAAAGLLDGALDSTGFMSWGEAGPGRHVTIYANPGHAFMVVDGRRFDTSNLSGGGTRWTSESRSTAGFVARHPPGL